MTLAIGEGEFFSLLGPSGCGKTTTLRMIAGFVEPDGGRILLHGSDVTSVPPNRRPVNMVFQQYALFPHMSIYDNVAFGLSVKRVPRREHRERVNEILRVVALEGFERRRPRAALRRPAAARRARARAREPSGGAPPRRAARRARREAAKHMQLELKRIQHELGTTFVYVTHDQEEALAMSDRIAVMNGGQVEQIGTPREIYEHPASVVRRRLRRHGQRARPRRRRDLGAAGAHSHRARGRQARRRRRRRRLSRHLPPVPRRHGRRAASCSVRLADEPPRPRRGRLGRCRLSWD